MRYTNLIAIKIVTYNYPIRLRETLIYSRRNAPQGPPGQAREGVLWYNIRR